MPELANLWVGVGADISEFRRNMGKVGSQTREVGKTVTGVGKTMTKGLTLPIAGAAAGVASMASSFQSAMNEVEAVTQPTTAELAKMEEAAKRLGRTTQFSASEAAEGMKFLGQAGLTASEQMEALSDMLDLAAAGSLDLGRAADIATDLTASFGLEVEEMGRVNDVLAETASIATTDVAKMADTMKQVAPVAKSSGISLEETSAAAGVLANSGIKASQAGTQLRGVIAKMEAPTKQQKKVMDELGVSFTDAEGNTVGLIEAVRRMSEAGASTGEIMQIFGRRAGTAMAALVEKGAPTIREFEGELKGAQGRAREMAETKMQGLPGALKKLKSAFEGMALAIADAGVVDTFVAITEKVRSVMQTVAEANPTLLKVGVILAGVVAAAGPLLAMLGLLVTGLGALLSPVGLVIAGLGGFAAALATAYAKSEKFRDVVNGAFDAVKSAVGPTIGWLGDRLEDVGEFFGLTRKTVADEVEEMSNKAVGEVVEMSQQMISEAHKMKHRVGDRLSSEMADRWIANVKKIADKSISEAQRQHEEVVKSVTALDEDLTSITSGMADDVIESSRQQTEETVRMNRLAKERALEQIKRLRDSGVSVSREQAEKIIASFENQRDRAVRALTQQEQEATNVLSRLEAESGKISVRMAAKAIRQSAKQGDKTVQSARQEYRERVDTINQMARESDQFTREMADEAIAEAKRQRDTTIENARSQHRGVVGEIKEMREGVEHEVNLQNGNVLSSWDKFWNDFTERLNSGFSGFLIDSVKWLVSWDEESSESIGGTLARWTAKFNEWFSKTSAALGEWLSNIIDDVRGWMVDLVGWFADLPGRIKNALGSLGSLLFGAGKDLLRGLIDGIKSMVGSAVSAVTDAVGSTVSAAKGAFGIRSPSKVFMEFGSEGVMSGLQKGIEAKQKDVARTVAKAMPTDLQVSGPDVSGADGASLGEVASLRGGDRTNVQVNVHGSVIRESELVDHIGEQVVSRIRRKTGMRD